MVEEVAAHRDIQDIAFRETENFRGFDLDSYSGKYNFGCAKEHICTGILLDSESMR